MTFTCNRCRREIHPDAPHKSGEHTPAKWCADCAATTFGPDVVLETRMAGLDKRKLAKVFPEFTEAMRALKARAQTKRVVTIGGE